MREEEAKEVLRPGELAPLLGVTRAHVYRLIAKGAIPAVRIGGAIRIPRAAWKSWLAEQSERALKSATERRDG
jgi:excisionase family DNA binding protein